MSREGRCYHLLSPYGDCDLVGEECNGKCGKYESITVNMNSNNPCERGCGFYEEKHNVCAGDFGIRSAKSCGSHFIYKNMKDTFERAKTHRELQKERNRHHQLSDTYKPPVFRRD